MFKVVVGSVRPFLICCFITRHPASFLCLSLYFVSLNLKEEARCLSISDMSAYCVGKGLKRRSVNSCYQME